MEDLRTRKEIRYWNARIATLQGIYFFITGVWPLLDIHSFMLVTGPKTDLWLVRAVAVLIMAIGLSLLVAVRRNEVLSSVAWLAVLSAFGLLSIDVFYVFTRVISPIYLGDAIIEFLLIIAWLFHWPRPQKLPPRL